MDLGEEPGRSKKPEPEASSTQASSSAQSSSTSQLPVTKVRSPTKASSSKATCSSQPLSSVQASSSTQQSYASRAPTYTSSPFKEPLPGTSVKMKSPLSTGGTSSVESSQGKSPVELEGWVRLWENPNGILSADISWLKEDTERGMFTPVQTYRDHTGHLKRRRVMKSDRMWFYPPERPGYVGGSPPNLDLFFRGRVFVWRPVGVWRCSLKCPRGDACVGAGQNVHLYKSGYHHRVRHICDVSNWYTMLTEVLC
nr:uncharacterized protein LOC111844772 [Paramormyrops kingsleyae]